MHEAREPIGFITARPGTIAENILREFARMDLVYSCSGRPGACRWHSDSTHWRAAFETLPLVLRIAEPLRLPGELVLEMSNTFRSARLAQSSIGYILYFAGDTNPKSGALVLAMLLRQYERDRHAMLVRSRNGLPPPRPAKRSYRTSRVSARV